MISMSGLQSASMILLLKLIKVSSNLVTSVEWYLNIQRSSLEVEDILSPMSPSPHTHTSCLHLNRLRYIFKSGVIILYYASFLAPRETFLFREEVQLSYIGTYSFIQVKWVPYIRQYENGFYNKILHGCCEKLNGWVILYSIRHIIPFILATADSTFTFY